MPRCLDSLLSPASAAVPPLFAVIAVTSWLSVSHARRSIASFFLILAVASALAGPDSRQGPGPKEVVLRAYTFKYQRASEALSADLPAALAAAARSSYQPQGNTLVIRDIDAAIRAHHAGAPGFRPPGSRRCGWR